MYSSVGIGNGYILNIGGVGENKETKSIMIDKNSVDGLAFDYKSGLSLEEDKEAREICEVLDVDGDELITKADLEELDIASTLFESSYNGNINCADHVINLAMVKNGKAFGIDTPEEVVMVNREKVNSPELMTSNYIINNDGTHFETPMDGIIKDGELYKNLDSAILGSVDFTSGDGDVVNVDFETSFKENGDVLQSQGDVKEYAIQQKLEEAFRSLSDKREVAEENEEVEYREKSNTSNDGVDAAELSNSESGSVEQEMITNITDTETETDTGIANELNSLVAEGKIQGLSEDASISIVPDDAESKLVGTELGPGAKRVKQVAIKRDDVQTTEAVSSITGYIVRVDNDDNDDNDYYLNWTDSKANHSRPLNSEALNSLLNS